MKHPDNNTFYPDVQERIMSAAVAYLNSEVVVLGYRHFCPVMRRQILDLQSKDKEEFKRGNQTQGFFTTYGRFVSRQQALELATQAGQLKGKIKHPPFDKLFSEDIW